MTMQIQCPTCKKPVQWTEAFPYRPFCSERCRIIELGNWADESYRVPAEQQAEEHKDEE